MKSSSRLGRIRESRSPCTAHVAALTRPPVIEQGTIYFVIILVANTLLVTLNLLQLNPVMSTVIVRARLLASPTALLTRLSAEPAGADAARHCGHSPLHVAQQGGTHRRRQLAELLDELQAPFAPHRLRCRRHDTPPGRQSPDAHRAAQLAPGQQHPDCGAGQGAQALPRVQLRETHGHQQSWQPRAVRGPWWVNRCPWLLHVLTCVAPTESHGGQASHVHHDDDSHVSQDGTALSTRDVYPMVPSQQFVR